jgi:PAS domain S-box-containing protein
MLGSLQILVCALDAEGRFVYINNASLHILGYHPEELIGQSCFDLMVEKDKARSYIATRNAWQGAHIPTFENQYFHKDGRIITLFWEGGWDKDAQLLYTSCRDVTEQRRLEKIERDYRNFIKASQNQLEALIERIADGFLGLDTDARVVYWNKTAETITGMAKERMIGHTLWDVLPEPTSRLARQQYDNIQTRRNPVHVVYFAHPIQRWMEIHAYISETGVSVFFRDITDQKALEEQLKEEKEQRHLEQEETQKQITAAVIRAAEQERAYVGRELHDNINQVLTTVKLYTEICAASPEGAASFLPKCTDLLTQSINEIRRLSKQLAAPAIQTVGLSEAISELVSSIQLTKKVEVKLDLPPFSCSTIDEELQLITYRIAQEHFTNILKHAKASFVKVVLSCTESYLTLIISDNGVGFDVSKKGKGMGMTNMFSRVAITNGVLNIKSETGKGCTLFLRFPVSVCDSNCSSGSCQ